MNKLYLERYPSNTDPKPILEPRKEIEWEARAVFNPSVVYDNGIFRMLYRTYPEKLGFKELRKKRPGFYFKNQISYIGYAESTDGTHFTRRDLPFIAPDTDCDRYGCEDPRMTKIGDTFYITYTAIDNPIDEHFDPSVLHVRVALATTKDFKTVTKHGIIGPSEHSKAAAFFPEMVRGGKIGLMMTLSSDSANSRVCIRYYDSMEDVLKSTFADCEEFLPKHKAVLKTDWWLHRGP